MSLSIRGLMKRTLSRFVRPNRSPSVPQRTRLAVEGLEGRELMAAALTATLNGGVLRVEGTSANDVIHVRYDASRVVSVDGVAITTGTGAIAQVGADTVQKILVVGAGGNDAVSVDMGTSPPATTALVEGHSWGTLGSGTTEFRVQTDGTAYGLGGDGVLRSSAAGAATWPTVVGGASKLCQGSNGSVYALAGGYVYRNGLRTWAAQDFAVDGNGSVYLLQADHTLDVRFGDRWADGWKTVASGVTKFVQEPNGSVDALAGGNLYHNGAVTAIGVTKFVQGPNGTVYAFSPQEGWLYVNGERGQEVRDFALGSDGTTYWVKADGRLQIRAPGQSSADQLVIPGVTKFTQGPNGSVYALADGWVYRNGLRTWSARDFAVDGNRSVYLLQADHTLDYRSRDRWADGWKQLATGVTTFEQRANDGAVFALTAGGAVYRNESRLSVAAAQNLAIDGNGTVYLLQGGNLNYRKYDQWAAGWQTAAAGVTKFVQRSADSAVFAFVPSTGTVYVNGGVWQGGQDFALDQDGTAYVLKASGTLLVKTYAHAADKQIDGVTKFVQGADGSVYALAGGFMHHNGQQKWAIRDFAVDRDGGLYLWRADGDVHFRNVGEEWQIINAVTKFEQGADGNAYALAGGYVYRNGGQSGRWVADSFDFGTDGSLYLFRDGRLSHRASTGWEEVAGGFVSSTTLILCGTDRGDQLKVYEDRGQVWITGGVLVGDGVAGDRVLAAQIGMISAYGNGGDDLIDISRAGAHPSKLRGSDGNDVLIGGAGDDLLDSGSGEDVLIGGAGDDTLYGGAGADRLDGGAGLDGLFGGQGTDTLVGGPDSDRFLDYTWWELPPPPNCRPAPS